MFGVKNPRFTFVISLVGALIATAMVFYLMASAVGTPEPFIGPVQSIDNRVITVSEIPGCDDSIEGVEELIKSSTACSTHDDCQLFYPGCPFGCGVALARSEVDRVSEAISRRNENACSTCVYRCVSQENAYTICERGTCRYINSGLQNIAPIDVDA